LFVISSPSAASKPSSKSARSDLLDQSALSTLAQRLVEAAKRAGADAADAVAVRGVSQGVEVRDGRVEESERSEGDDVGLRVLVGRRQAVVSTNDIKSDVSQLAERAVAMARVAPEDPFAGLADPARLAREIPDLDLLDPDLPTVAILEERAKRAEWARRAYMQGLVLTSAAARQPQSPPRLATRHRRPRGPSRGTLSAAARRRSHQRLHHQPWPRRLLRSWPPTTEALLPGTG